MVPFIEVSRRDIGQAWKKYYSWPDSYARYIQYIWARYQANICLYSPIHLDTMSATIKPDEWNQAANTVVAAYGQPPFGTPAGTNSNPSSLRNWGHIDNAKWLTFHQIGNQRTHNCYKYLTEIFQTNPAVPGINGEPYYDGMLDAESGTAKAALYCRSAMYGSVLSGGLGGHIYGAGGWQGGMWSGEVEAASKYPIWDVIQWESGADMQHLANFVLSEERRYVDLVPMVDRLSPNKSGEEKSCVGWAYCAGTREKDFFLLYYERDCPTAKLSGVKDAGRYKATWYDPRTGKWIEAGVLHADGNGIVTLPKFVGGTKLSKTDWGLKLLLEVGADVNAKER
jgi:hypothetical protein